MKGDGAEIKQIKLKSNNENVYNQLKGSTRQLEGEKEIAPKPC